MIRTQLGPHLRECSFLWFVYADASMPGCAILGTLGAMKRLHLFVKCLALFPGRRRLEQCISRLQDFVIGWDGFSKD